MERFSRYGHRGRMRQAYLNNGIDSFDSCNVLELYLSLIIPQRDVKPLAYTLMNKFGSLKGIFDAGVDDLTSVNGVGENTAFLIKSSRELMFRTVSDGNYESRILDNGRVRATFACSVLRDDGYAVIFLNNNSECISRLYFDKNIDMQDIRTAIIKKAVAVHAPMCYMVKRDSSTCAELLDTDINILVDLKIFLLKFSVKICDYIVIGKSDAYIVSQSPNKKLLYC